MNENDHSDLPEILEYIPCNACSYEEWLLVGMALKESGIDFGVWDDWSRTDSDRYKKGECLKKWWGFKRHDVKSGTIIDIAKRFGYDPNSDGNELLDWDSTFEYVPDPTESNLKIIDKNWVQGEDVPLPGQIFGGPFDPTREIKTYLETLFRSDEYVAYSVDCYESKSDDGKPSKWLPKASASSRTAGELIQALVTSDISCTFGTIHEEAGAWIRFNPMDGKGYRDENVSDYRYALVECDDMPIDKQYAMIRQMELPVAIMIHSGGKSIHAIVKVDASSMSQYRERVDYLYKVCETNGLKLDKQNRNPSRLSRMPGVMRQGRPQYIISLACGKDSWNEWVEYVEAINDDLPDFENLADVHELPPLAPEMIEGILRAEHKLLLSGPSKAGKSFALIELCVAVAEGLFWMGQKCRQGKVLYINLELDPVSCLHRFNDVYIAMGIDISNAHFENISIWNLRGKSEPIDKLVPKLIRRAKQQGFTMIIVDPIYKILTGDENSASDMSLLCNQFDKIASQLQACVINAHHHSKGDKRNVSVMDRASGSGVFARDPDALVDMIEIKIPQENRDLMVDKARRNAALDYLKNARLSTWMQDLEGVDLCNTAQIISRAKDCLPSEKFAEMQKNLRTAETKAENRTAWKIEFTLREFANHAPVYVWFDHPLHIPDDGTIAEVENNKKQDTGKPKMTREERTQAMQDGRKKAMEQKYDTFRDAIRNTNGYADEVFNYIRGGEDVPSKRTIIEWGKAVGYRLIGGRFLRVVDDFHPFEEEES